MRAPSVKSCAATRAPATTCSGSYTRPPEVDSWARWRVLATSGVSLEQAALEIGVTAVELRAY